MQLRQVIINNFKNVSSRVIDIPEDTNKAVIQGKNMSGKTNTLNAIHWAFTGKTIDGDVSIRSIIPTTCNDENLFPFVSLKFDGGFTFIRRIVIENGTPSVEVLIDGVQAKTIKAGEAMLHKKLGLTDLILNAPKDFNIMMFLLNPLYFETVSPSALRKFFYLLSNTDFNNIALQQNRATLEVLKKRDKVDPYLLADEVSKEKRAIKKIIEGCKTARSLFPDIVEQANEEERKQCKKLKEIEIEEALIDRYSLMVSKRVNSYYKKAMGIEVCLLENGVGEDVFKDVCYPILPKSHLPFSRGSFAERTFVGVKFIIEVCLTYNIQPLPLLIDNMESLDETTTKYLNELNALYIGAKVKEENK